MTKGINRMLGIIVLAATFFGVMHSDVCVMRNAASIELKTEYGDYIVSEPVLIELFESPAFNRLRLIHQYGVCCYARNEKPFTRYDHSIGVFVLLRRYGACLEEQIAGLLHDVSHTVFSHVGDVVFGNYYDRYSYQDNIHEKYLQESGITDILCKHGYGDACLAGNKKKQRMLEQDKPDLCIDRIEYLLRGGLVDNLIAEQDIEPILQNLYFENQQWIFNNKDQANKLANIALQLTENVFGSSWNLFIYYHASQALKNAVEIGLLTMDDIHFSTDDVVWQKMCGSSNLCIAQSIDKIIHYSDYFTAGNPQNYDQYFKAKFLGVDPLVETQSSIVRLSTIDPAYAGEYARVQNKMAQGCYIKFVGVGDKQ